MSASRSSSMRALRQLSRYGQTRQLHMTEPKTFPSRVLASNKGHATPGMPAEKPVSPGPSQTQQAADVSAPTRPIATTTMAGPARPTISSAAQPTNNRAFNTSRELKSQRDNSTIDFAFLPQDAGNLVEPDVGGVRVPIVPDLWEPLRTGAQVIPPPDYESVHRVQIATAAGEATHVAAPSAMSELHDNESVPVDHDAVTERLTVAQGNDASDREPSTMKQLWDGFLEDLRGEPPRGAALS